MPSGPRARTSSAGVAAGTTVTVARSPELAEHGLLDPEVVGHDPVGAARPASRRVGVVTVDTRSRPSVGGAARAAASRSRLGGRAEGAGHRPVVAQVAGEAPGVHPGDPGHAVALQEGLEGARRAPVGGGVGQVAHHHAAAVRPDGLVVGRVHPVVADVGIGEGDDLPGVRRVGDDLLVAGEHGVEHRLAGRDAVVGHGAEGLALEDGAVGQDEEGRLPADGARAGAHRWASASITTGSPASTVWRTRPVSVRPA